MEIPKAPQVDLSDPEDVRRKLPAVDKMVEFKRREYATWRTLREQMAVIAGVEAPAPERPRGSKVGARLRGSNAVRITTRKPSTQVVAVEIVNKAGKAMSVADVATAMPDAKRETVGWALWKAADEDQLQKVKQGIYAPLGYQPADEELASMNGTSAEGGEQE